MVLNGLKYAQLAPRLRYYLLLIRYTLSRSSIVMNLFVYIGYVYLSFFTIFHDKKERKKETKYLYLWNIIKQALHDISKKIKSFRITQFCSLFITISLNEPPPLNPNKYDEERRQRLTLMQKFERWVSSPQRFETNEHLDVRILAAQSLKNRFTVHGFSPFPNTLMRYELQITLGPWFAQTAGWRTD